MKKYIFIPILLISVLIIDSCNNNTDNPVSPTPQTGSIYIQSQPTGAQIWVDGVNSGKVTNDSVSNVQPGSHNITLKLQGYRDTTLQSISVTAGLQTSKFVQLTSNLITSSYGPVQIYETTNTTVQQPSGLILKDGSTSGIGSSAPNKDKVDLFYYSDTAPTYDLRSADLTTSLSRATYFYAASSSNLYDGASSPAKTSSWVKKIDDDRDTSKYYFVYDQDGHYSKFKIVNFGGGTGPGDPAWVKVSWIYNDTQGDQRFPNK